MVQLLIKTFKTESDENILRVLKGEMNYDDLPIDDNNEIVKGYFFYAQALFIKNYEKFKIPKCGITNSNCKKERCCLYNEIDLGWVCREYKVIFDNINKDAMMAVRGEITSQIQEIAKEKNLSVEALIVE